MLGMRKFEIVFEAEPEPQPEPYDPLNDFDHFTEMIVCLSPVGRRAALAFLRVLTAWENRANLFDWIHLRWLEWQHRSNPA